MRVEVRKVGSKLKKSEKQEGNREMVVRMIIILDTTNVE